MELAEEFRMQTSIVLQIPFTINMAFNKCVVSFFKLGECASFERFRTRIPQEECTENILKFKKAVSEFCGLKEACSKHGLGDFDIKLFRISKQSKESYAIHTQFRRNLERGSLLSDTEGNELNGKEIKSVDGLTRHLVACNKKISNYQEMTQSDSKSSP